MFGVMGTSAAFAQAASAKKAKSKNYLVFKGSTADATINRISCTGEISVESIKNGQAVIATYTDLTDTQVSIQAGANTDVMIKGDVTKIVFKEGYGYGDLIYLDVSNDAVLEELGCQDNTGLVDLDLHSNINLKKFSCTYSGLSSLNLLSNTKLQELQTSYTSLTSLDLSNNVALTTLHCAECTGLTSLNLSNNTALTLLNCTGCTGLTSLDLSNNVALTSLTCTDCTGLTSLDLSDNVALTSLTCKGCTGLTSLNLSNNTALTSLTIHDYKGWVKSLTQVKYPATNDSVSTEVAGIITNADSDSGTVYTDSAADYYQTIADAATAKGWTIEQL